MVASSTDLSLTVARVDQLEGVSPGEGVAGHAEPGAAEDDQEEKADDVRAAAPAVGTFVRGIVVVVFVGTHLVFGTAAAHFLFWNICELREIFTVKLLAASCDGRYSLNIQGGDDYKS